MLEKPRLSATAGLVLALVVCLSLAAYGQSSDRTRPKLLVVLVADQMRADYVDMYGHQWTAGLRRLFDEGAWFSEAAYPYLATFTCAGHATIATGRFPSAHGMVKNEWWDRGSARQVRCTTDDSVTPVAYGGSPRERHSPRSLLQPTLSDVLREQSPGPPRVVSVSIKPRTAVTLAGQHADNVVWFDEAYAWASSSAYTDAPVAAMQQFVADHPVEGHFDRVWTRLLPTESYLHDDTGMGERPDAGWETTFPHALGDASGQALPESLERWRNSPFADQYLVDMALTMVDAFGLGAGEGTDYLAVGLSGVDLVGHDFGPESHEVQDTLVRLDLELGRLLRALDSRLGRNQYVVAFTSDHGVAPIPEAAKAHGIDAGRLRGSDLVRAVESHLDRRLSPAKHVAAYVSGDLYFEPGVYQTLKAEPPVLQSVLDLIAGIPGVAKVYRGDELSRHAANGDPLARAAQLSYFEGRSGDLIVVLDEYWITSNDASTHGSPYAYDTRVPIVLFGSGVAPGRYTTPTTPADIAPTLASILGISMPEGDGRELTEALSGR